MKKLNILISGLVLFSVACSHEPKPVNPSATSVSALDSFIVPSQKPGESSNEILHRNSRAALSGKMYVINQISTLLPNTAINVFQILNGQRKLISEIQTDHEGQFKITQELFRGRYELQPKNPKYEGRLSINLDDKPERDLIFEVTLKK